MLNLDLQLTLLKALQATYVDEKRIEITSEHFEVTHDLFVFNLLYLKREKLIDLSSLSTRAAVVTPLESDEVETVQAATTHEGFTTARCLITHAGIKALATQMGTKFIRSTDTI